MKSIPVKNRQVKYTSSIWDYEEDGQAGTGNVLKTNGEPLPLRSPIVSVLLEFLESPTSATTPVVFVLMNDGSGSFVPISAPFNLMDYTAGDVVNFAPNFGGAFPEIGGGYPGFIIIGAATGGKCVITIGYLDPGEAA